MRLLGYGGEGLRGISEALGYTDQSPPLSLDIETYSPNGFPYDGGDPVVSVSLARPLYGDPRLGLEASSIICHPSLEPELLRNLSNLFGQRLEGLLLTYNGLHFDIPYLQSRANRYGIDLKRRLEGALHIDLYQLIRGSGLRLTSYRQKDVEEYLGIWRQIRDVNGGNYYRYYQSFLKNWDIRPMLYNMEDALLMHIILYALKKRLKGRIPMEDSC